MSGSPKLIYLAFVRLPTEKAHGVQIMKTCEALARAGVSVELVVPGRATPIVEDAFVHYGVEKNFVITSLKTPDWVQFGSIGYTLSLLWFAEAVRFLKTFWSADIVYSRDALVLAQYVLLGRKLVYEAHTQPTIISRFVARRAHVVAISEGLRDVYLKAGVRLERILVAHDAADPIAFQKPITQRDARAFLGISDATKVALYVGRIDAAKGADTFAAASTAVDPTWTCVLVGGGPNVASLTSRYPQARFVPETPYRDLPTVLAAADVLVLPNSLKDENASNYTSPLKAFAYLASGRPIVASRVPALEQILTDQPNVVFFDADNTRSLAESINATVHTERIARRVYSWDDRAAAINRFLFD